MPKTAPVLFDALGKITRPFRSRTPSTSCDVPVIVVARLINLLGIKDELMAMERTGADVSVCDILSTLVPATCMRGWRVTAFIGSGQDGYVFGCRPNKGVQSDAALKIMHSTCEKDAREEIERHQAFAALGLSPRVHRHCMTMKKAHPVFFMRMDTVDATASQWLESKRSNKLIDSFVESIFRVLRFMREKGVTHGDCHLGNIELVFKREGSPGKIQLIDHGHSTTRGAVTEIEIVHLLHSCMHRESVTHGATNKYLQHRIREQALRVYGIRPSTSKDILRNRAVLLTRKVRKMNEN